jgi:peptidoglycan/LPS O-acetylase OafA/YrhL
MRFFNIAVFLIVPSVLLVGWLDHAHTFQREIKPLRWMGDTAYSIYLWHFPIQVAILTAIEYFGFGRAAFHSPLGLILWIGGILAVGHFSFRAMERPLQVRAAAALRKLVAFRPAGVPFPVGRHHVVMAPGYRRAMNTRAYPSNFRSPRVTKARDWNS